MEVSSFVRLSGVAIAAMLCAGLAMASDGESETTGAGESATAMEAGEGAMALLAEADLAAGEEKYQAVCRNCHGPTAKGMSAFPKLAGSEAEHLVTMLELYRDGEKVGHNSGLMWPVAEELSDQDIADIVGYITETF